MAASLCAIVTTHVSGKVFTSHRSGISPRRLCSGCVTLSTCMACTHRCIYLILFLSCFISTTQYFAIVHMCRATSTCVRSNTHSQLHVHFTESNYKLNRKRFIISEHVWASMERVESGSNCCMKQCSNQVCPFQPLPPVLLLLYLHDVLRRVPMPKIWYTLTFALVQEFHGHDLHCQ